MEDNKLKLYFPKIDFSNENYIFSLIDYLTNFSYPFQQRYLIIEYISNNLEFISTLIQNNLYKKDNKGLIEILIDYYINNEKNRNLIMNIFTYFSENIMLEQSNFNYIYFLLGKEIRENKNFNQQKLSIYLELLFIFIKNIGKKYDEKYIDFFHFYSLNTINLINIYPKNNLIYEKIKNGFGIQIIFYVYEQLMNDRTKIIDFNSEGLNFQILLNNKKYIEIFINKKSKLKNPFIIRENCWINFKIIFQTFPSNIKLICLISCDNNPFKFKIIDIPFFDFDIHKFIFFEKFKGRIGPIVFFNINDIENILFKNKYNEYSSIDKINNNNIISVLSPKKFNEDTFHIKDIYHNFKGEIPINYNKETFIKCIFKNEKCHDNIFTIGNINNLLPIIEILINNPFNFTINEEKIIFSQIISILKEIFKFNEILFICEKNNFWKFFSIILERINSFDVDIIYDFLIQILETIYNTKTYFIDFFYYIIFNEKIKNKFLDNQINNLSFSILKVSEFFNEHLFYDFYFYIFEKKQEKILFEVLKNETIKEKNKYLLFVILIQSEHLKYVDLILTSLINFFSDISISKDLKINLFNYSLENDLSSIIISLLEIYPQNLKFMIYKLILNISFSFPTLINFNEEKNKKNFLISLIRNDFYNYLLEIEESDKSDYDKEENSKLNIFIQIINNIIKIMFSSVLNQTFLVEKKIIKKRYKEENVIEFFNFFSECFKEQKFDKEKKINVIKSKFIRNLSEIALNCFFLSKNEENKNLKECYLKLYNSIIIILQEIFEAIDNYCINYIFKNCEDDKKNLFNLLTSKYFIFGEARSKVKKKYLQFIENHYDDYDNYIIIKFEYFNNIFNQILKECSINFSNENLYQMITFIEDLYTKIIKEKKCKNIIHDFIKMISTNFISFIDFFLTELNEISDIDFFKIFILIIYSGFYLNTKMNVNLREINLYFLFLFEYFLKRAFLGYYLGYISKDIILFIFNLIHFLLISNKDYQNIVNFYTVLTKFNFLPKTNEQIKKLIFDKKFLFNNEIMKKEELLFNIINKKKYEIICRCLFSNFNQIEQVSFKEDLNFIQEKKLILINIIKKIGEINLIINIEEDKNNIIKKYRKFKKNIYLWNNAYSDLNIFYSSEGKKKLKFKNYYHLTKDLINPLIVPIIDIDSYLKKFINFIPSNQLFKDYINSFYKINLNNSNLTYENINKKHYQLLECFEIKIISQIRGSMFIYKDYIEFIQKKRKNNEKISNEKNCWIDILFNENEISNDYYLKINIKDIKFIFPRKYYDKEDSIEIFTIHNKSYYFRFLSEKTKSNFLNYITNYPNMKKEITNLREIIGYKNEKDYYYINNIQLNKYWKERKITTLNYIMSLNILSNRSLRDLTQYPIFPWFFFNKIFSDNTNINVLNDNFNNYIFNSNAFLQNLMNNKIEKENFNAMKSKSQMITQQVPNEFLFYKIGYYNNLYSVSYFLTRFIPFSFSSLNLIEKKFSLFQQLFQNKQEQFILYRDNKSIREIIPEYYYLPEFFYNLNNLNLNYLFDCDHYIKLPHWSNNNSFIFIMVMREFLENHKLNINFWIDCFFGLKQKNFDFLKPYYSSSLNLSFYDKTNLEKIVKDNEFCNYFNQSLFIDCDNIIENKNVLYDLYNFNLENYFMMSIDCKIIDINLTNENLFLINNHFQFKKENFNYVIEEKLHQIFNDDKDELLLYNKPLIKSFNKCNYYIFTGFYNGEIYLFNSNDKKLSKVNNPIKYFDNIITFIEIDLGEEYLILGTLLGSIILYEINLSNPEILIYKKFVKNHEKKIIFINSNYNLNMIIDSSEDYYINLYTLPKLNLVHSIKNNYLINFAFLSSSPLPSFIIYSHKKCLFNCYNINGFFLAKEQDNLFDYEKVISPLIYTDFNFIDYLIYIKGQKIFVRKFPFMNLIFQLNIQNFFSDIENCSIKLILYHIQKKLFLISNIKNKSITIYKITKQ